MMKVSITILVLILSLSQLKSQEWNTNFSQAQEIAKSNELPIILVFQGSDWCAPCIKLDKEIWSSVEFKEYSKDHYVLVQADFPRRKANKLPADLEKQNAQLAEKYNSKGYFPHVVILNANGEVLGRTGYEKKSPKEYITKINSLL